MNEKITELMMKATKDMPETYYWPGQYVEKFAELIVKECIAITDGLVNRNVDGSWTSNELYTDYNGALFEVKRRIQDSFGVEE